MYLHVTAVIMSSVLALPALAGDTVFSAIQKREAVWSGHFAQNEMTEVGAMYEEHAWLISPGAAPLKGREEILGAVSVLRKNTARLALTTVAVEPVGADYAIENGVAEMVGAGDASNSVGRANYQVLWHRSNEGVWLIIRDMISPM